MKSLRITLPDELAQFVEDAVASGDWPDTDRLIEYAITTLRTEIMLGKGPETLPVTTSRTPTPASIPVVDTTRESFDSSGFMEGLMQKLRTKK
jgi:Arc/MetJ-type ribon-helix-helix transcriptional regulator